jgi:2-polyprenyl-3-methyl-5-hydroxy-6-metoxy-1,4-benzoquinol methylase
MSPSSPLSCPLCGSASVPWRQLDGAELGRCGTCGSAFQLRAPGPQEIEALYQGEYFDSWNLNEAYASVENMKRRTARRILEGLSRWVQSGRLLDVGCALGFLLDEARVLGWDAYGVEISPFAAKRAQERFGSRVSQGTLETLEASAGSFRAITMIDSIEHVARPGALVRRARELLEPGGVLSVLTPDLGSISARLFGSRWPHFKREHLFYATRRGLSRLMEAAGFEPLLVSSAPKILTLDYVAGVAEAYPVPIMTPLLSGLRRILPEGLRRLPVCLPSGELLAYFRRQ